VDTLSYRQSDPSPPDWRWQLAVDLAEETTGPFRPCRDPAVRSAKRFWRWWADCRGEADRRLLARRMPIMDQAFRVYSDPGGVTRSALEARVLANEPPEAIAAKGATEAAVVRAYELIFYDVRGRLQSPDYILNRAIGPRLRDYTTGWDYDLVWKFFGYVGGAFVLDEIMDTCGAGPRPANPLGVAAFLTADARAALRRQLAVAARALRGGDRKTAAALIQGEARRAGRGGEDEAAPNVLARHIEALFNEIPWAVGADAEEHLPPPVAECDRGAAELRDDELSCLAAGQEPQGLADVKALELPPPRGPADAPQKGK
jgi:hypothetical protein